MNLSDILNRPLPPEPWAEGDNIPWHDPAFSERMLNEHLSQDHDAASRRSERIDRHVQWIHEQLLAGRASRILDLGCGPGLYAQRLASFGHECVGIDYSPASIAHAVAQAKSAGLGITYRHEDLREAEFGSGFDLVMLIFGELNVFAPSDAKLILGKAAEALKGEGKLLLEVHTFGILEEVGQKTPSWYASEAGLFSSLPHLCLQEHFWDEEQRVATTRYLVIDTATGEVTTHAASYQAYSDEEYEELLTGCGFCDVTRHPSLGEAEDGDRGLTVLTAAKPGS